MKTKAYEVKNEDEALALASKEFGLSEDELVVKILSEKKGFLGIGSSKEVEVTVGIDPIEKGKRYLQTILEQNQVEDGFVEKIVRDNVVEYNISAGDFNGILIGKNSKHMIALQILVSSVVNAYYGDDEARIVKVDVGGYRRRRESNLERLAVEYGKQVVKTRQSVTLDGLNSYERKIVHDRLSTWRDLKTHSEGEEPNRFLIIEYVGKKRKEPKVEETEENVTIEKETNEKAE